MKDLNKIAKSSFYSYKHAKSLHFKNVPKIILESIAEDYGYSYCYAYHLNFKNVPLIIIKSISKSDYYSHWYAEFLHFKNVPLIIIKSAINYYDWYIDDFPENKHLLIYMLQCDKRMNIII